MKHLVFICLTVSSFSLKSNSQRVTQNPNILNPDQIYFADNRPDIGKPGERQINRPSVDLEPPFRRPNEVQQNGLNGLPNPYNPFGQYPFNGPNGIQLVTNDYNVVKPVKPVENVEIVQHQVYEQPEVHSRVSEEDKLEIGDEKRKARFDQIGAAMTNFSLNVMKNVITQKQGNSVVSPYSIAALLSLLQQGATEQTLEQISAALQMSPVVSAAAYKGQTLDIQNRNYRNLLRTANNIFVADSFSVNPQFKAVAQNDFASDVTPTSFQRPEDTARLINNWVASKTSNKIVNLMSPESISVDTQMVLVNTIYFKGLWEIPFRPQATKPDGFLLRDGTVKNVPFMMTRRFFKAGIDSMTESRVVILPFEREEYLMMIILPSQQSNADKVIQELTVSHLENYFNMKPIEVVLKIPKFTIRADTDLAVVLKKIGVTQIFDQNSGLSGVGMFRTFSPQVSSAVHSAVLSIDEEGGSAAAASAFTVVALSNSDPSMVVKVDRPFVAVLWDGKTKLPLFMAKIEDPAL